MVPFGSDPDCRYQRPGTPPTDSTPVSTSMVRATRGMTTPPMSSSTSSTERYSSMGSDDE